MGAQRERSAGGERLPDLVMRNVKAEHLRIGSVTESHLAVLVILVGVVLRLRLYLRGASLYLDEAMLANNIVDRSYAGFFQPLDYDQGAPLGFLFLQKLVIQTLGNADFKLRLWPLIAGIAALCLMYPVARRVLDAPGALIATALLAICPSLIFYAATVKQYSTDVFVSLLLLLAGLVAIDGALPRKPLLFLALGGALAVWLSHPAVFLLAGIGISLALYALSRRDWSGLAYLLGAAVLWSLAFLVDYLVSLKALSADESLTRYWQDSFLPMPFWQHLDWLGPAFLRLLDNPGGVPATLALVLSSGGIVWLLWKRWPVALVVTLPWLATLAASAAQRYPFGDRLVLFLLPSLYLTIGGGAELAERLAGRVWPHLAIPVSVAIALALMVVVVYGVWTGDRGPTVEENVKPLLTYVERHKQPDDVVFVYYAAEPSARYYAPFYELAGIRLVYGSRHREAPQAYLSEVDRFKGLPRVWVLFSHDCGWCQVDEQDYIVAHLDTLGMRVVEVKDEGVALYLYDLHAPP